jgi:hypothetical protein
MASQLGPIDAMALWICAAACASEPIPLSAQAGSTIAIGLAGEDTYSPALGYRSPYYPLDDPRGEILLRLVDDSAGGSVEIPLLTRYVTRVYADPASEAGLQSSRAPGGLGQILALVDVPGSAPPGRYRLRLARRDAQGDETTLPATPASLTVLPSAIPDIPDLTDGGALRAVLGAPTSAVGHFATASRDVSRSLALYVPNPKAVVRILPVSLEPPAGARLAVEYPAEKVEILAAFEDRHLGRGSIVRWRDSDPRGRLDVSLVDPDRSVSEIALVFRPLPGSGRSQVESREFRVLGSVFYLADGSVSEGHTAGVEAIR